MNWVVLDSELRNSLRNVLEYFDEKMITNKLIGRKEKKERISEVFMMYIKEIRANRCAFDVEVSAADYEKLIAVLLTKDFLILDKGYLNELAKCCEVSEKTVILDSETCNALATAIYSIAQLKELKIKVSAYTKILLGLLANENNEIDNIPLLRKEYEEIFNIVFSKAEMLEEPKKIISAIIKKIDDDKILKIKAADEIILYLLYLKYGVSISESEYIKERKISIEHIDLKENTLKISGYYLVSKFITDLPQYITLENNGSLIKGENVERWETKEFLDEEIADYYGFCFDIPLENSKASEWIFAMCSQNQFVCNIHVKWHNLLSPISDKLQCAYYCSGDWIVAKGKENSIIIDSKRKRNNYESKLIKELWTKNAVGMRKAVFVRKLVSLLKKVKRKEIWLFMDKAERADDNAEVLLDYIYKNEKPDAKSYFIIGKESKDYERLSKKFNVLPLLSLKHKIMYLVADVIVTGYMNEVNINPFFNFRYLYADMMHDIGYIFIEHGVKKDSMYNKVSRYKRNFDRVVCSGERERQNLLNEPTGLNEKQCVVTGLCRYDLLKDTSESRKSIVIAPTWRNYLTNGINRETSEHTLRQDFTESTYYKFYTELLNSERLNAVLSEKGYVVHFIPHATMLKESGVFEGNPNIKVWGDEVVHREIWGESSLFITDYSSAFFDFAYLYKPIIYAQFDYEQCYGAEGHREKSYFDYEKDGFGEVEYSLDATIDRIIEYIENGCVLKDIYKMRIDNFFTYHDQNNCKRVYEMVKEYLSERC